MATTTKGVFYPTSSDNIAPLETHLANIAQGADSVGVLAGQEGFVGPDATGSTAGVSVAFGVTLDSAPTVTCTVEAGAAASSYIATVTETTTTGFTAKVYRLNGSGADSTLKLHWMASDYS